MTIRIEAGSDTNVGRVREHNEDALEAIHFTGGDVLIVCDGMGGHAAGDVASSVACSTLAAGLVENQFCDPRELLYRTLEAAHQRVLAAAEASGHVGMGTTAVVGLIRKGALFLGHVGDSRAYLVRGGAVSQLTRDQTKVQDLVDKGLLTEEAAKSHPDAGVLAQAIGQPRGLLPFVTPDEGGITLQSEDVLVLCSDGVYDSLVPEDFRRLTANRSPEEAARALVAAAVERDGKDNATAVVAVARSSATRRGVPPTILESPHWTPRFTDPDGYQAKPGAVELERWGMRALAIVLLLIGLPCAFLLGRCTTARDAAPPKLPEDAGIGATDGGLPDDAGVDDAEGLDANGVP